MTGPIYRGRRLGPVCGSVSLHGYGRDRTIDYEGGDAGNSIDMNGV